MGNKLTKQKMLPGLSRSEKWYLLICFFVYLLWAVLFVTIYYGPDELMRLDILNFIYQNGRLPFGWEESLRHPMWGISYGFGFSLPYLIGALFMQFMSLFSASETALIIAARMTSVLCGVGVGCYAIRISRKLFSSRTRWLFIVLMTLLPQVVFLSSYFNRDIFGLFTVTMIIYSWLCGVESGWSKQSCIHLALALGLCFLSYEFDYPFILGSFLLYVFWYMKNRESVSFREFIRKGLLIVGVVFLVCGWMFIRNAIIYDGDVFALKILDQYQELYAVDSLKPSQISNYRAQGYPLLHALQDDWWKTNTCRSFLSMMGYMSVPAAQWVYDFFRLLLAFSGIGLIAGAVMKKGKTERHGFVLTALVFSSSVTVFLSVYYSWNMDIQAQGRYIIGILPLFALFVSKGIEGIGRLLSAGLRIDEKKSSTVLSVFLCLMVLLTAAEAFGNCFREFRS